MKNAGKRDILAVLLVSGLVLSLAGCASSITPEEARSVAKEAYIYGYPMVMSHGIHYAYFVDPANPECKAPWNQIHNNPRVYTPDDKAIPTPNSVMGGLSGKRSQLTSQIERQG